MTTRISRRVLRTRGAGLLLVLFLIVLLFIFAAVAGASLRQAAISVDLHEDFSQAQSIADRGVQASMDRLRNGKPAAFTENLESGGTLTVSAAGENSERHVRAAVKFRSKADVEAAPSPQAWVFVTLEAEFGIAPQFAILHYKIVESRRELGNE